MQQPYTHEKTYAPAKRCIYCGTTAGPLGREHIIPYALNGRAILPEASCRKCEKIINEEIEHICLSKVFRVPRTHLRMQSKSGLPENLLVISTPPGSAKIDLNTDAKRVPVSEHPFVFSLPGFAQPTALLGQPPSYKLIVKRFSIYAEPGWQDKYAALGFSEPLTVMADVSIFRPFARFLAKIAHGFLCAELAGQPFRPLLQEIILGKAERDFKSHYVGGPEESCDGHNIGGHGLKLLVNEKYLIVHIWLFGTGPYQVVAGTPL